MINQDNTEDSNKEQNFQPGKKSTHTHTHTHTHTKDIWLKTPLPVCLENLKQSATGGTKGNRS